MGGAPSRHDRRPSLRQPRALGCPLLLSLLRGGLGGAGQGLPKGPKFRTSGILGSQLSRPKLEKDQFLITQWHQEL